MTLSRRFGIFLAGLCLASAGLRAQMPPPAPPGYPDHPAWPFNFTRLPPADQILELRENMGQADILPYARFYEESVQKGPPRALSFLPDAETFLRSTPERTRGFLNAKAMWICFTVRSAASARSWLIKAGPATNDSVAAYIVDPDGKIETAISDAYARNGASRGILSGFVFRLTIGPEQVKTVYMRFAAVGPLAVEASVWDAFALLRDNEIETIGIGFILGVIVAIFCYTFFISLSLREGSFVFYLIYLFALFGLVVAENASAASYLRLGLPWIERRAIPFYSMVANFGILLFARRYLGISDRTRILSPFLLCMAVLVPFSLLALAFFDLRSVSAWSAIFDSLVLVVILVSAALSSWLNRRKRDIFFLLSWSLLFVGSLLVRLDYFGVFGLDVSWPLMHSETVGQVLQILLLSFSITDSINAMRTEQEAAQRRSIETLERNNRVKEDFVIGTSLELRSPLYGILGLVDAIEDLSRTKAASEELRLSGLLRAEAQRLLGIVANVTSYARLRNDDIAISIGHLSLKELASEITASVAHILSGKDLGLEVDIGDIELDSDPRLLRQIVYNLFSEACKRSPSGLITLRAEKRSSVELAGNVRLWVVDSAPKLPEEQLQRFMAATSGSRVVSEGVGPGLPLLVSRLLARRLGGELFYSWSEGRGSFILELPLNIQLKASYSLAPLLSARTPFQGWDQSRGIEEAVADLSESETRPDTRGFVLAYDEDPLFLESLKRYLEQRGYSVTPTVTAETAEFRAKARHFDLVLLDATSPNRMGLTVCSKIRASHDLGGLPIVIMTDSDSAEAVEAAFRAGASDYLPKLSPKELLFARVDTLIGLKRSVEETLETRKRIGELEKLKTLGVLAAGVAHEVNTPNNAVIRNIPIISEIWRELSPILMRIISESEDASIGGWSAGEIMTEIPELLTDTYAAGQQIKKIVEDLKDYARDSSSRPPEDVDVAEVAAYASRLLQPLIGKSTSDFSLVLGGDQYERLPKVRANFQKLTQVAVNVLENALQSLGNREASVRLLVYHDSTRGAVVLECQDHGSGIPEDIRVNIFEPFFTTKREAGGTGLGLSVSLGIVRDAGGEIEVESEQGRGTTVRVILPAIYE